ncbi:MAG: NAD-dependent epimerase/dehydratase family protein [Cellvibrionales bacterium]|nr:NAD-dependent epimerase/dehydratase family protein [Cellvibrionales bacterium]
MTGKKILMVGCGALGIATAKRLQANGYKVIGARRSISKLPADLPGIAIDITRPETLTALSQHNWYAVIVTLTADSFNHEAYQATYVDGLNNVLNSLESPSSGSSQAPMVIFSSSTSIYHQNNGAMVDENSETLPTSFSGQAMLAAEQQLKNYSGVSCALRFGGIYGRGLGRLAQRLTEGFICPSEPVLYSNRIHFEDCCRAIVHLVDLHQQQVAFAPCYLAVDSKPSLLREVMEWLAVKQGLNIDELQGTEAPVRGGNKQCNNAALLKTGFVLEYPDYRAGFAPFFAEQ